MLVLLQSLLIISSPILSTAIPAKDFYSFGVNETDRNLPHGDSEEESLTILTSFPFFGNSHTTLYVHTDGVISLNQSASFTVSPFPLNNNIQLIAPFFADADTTRLGTVWFRETNDTTVLKKAEEDIDRAFPNQISFQPQVAFIATWAGIGYHDTQPIVDLVNTFQCVLVTDGILSFVIFLYADEGIQWTTGDGGVSGGVDGLGGSPAQVGFNAGDGVRSYRVPESQTAAVLNIFMTSNVGVPGVWIFQVNGEDIGTPISEAPVIVTQTNVTKPFDIGDDVALSCTAMGAPRPSFQWYKDGALLVNESLTFITSVESDVSSPLFTISILYLCSVDEFDLGIYSCQAANFAGNTSYEFEIQVNIKAPIIIIQTNITRPLNIGDSVILGCTALGIPHPSFQWYKLGVLFANESLSFISSEESSSNGVLFTTSTLCLQSMDEFDIGTYTCLATNSAGNDTVEFEIQINLEVPVIEPGVNISEPLKVGDNVSLSCNATGVPHPLLQWYKNNIVIMNASMIFISTKETNIGGESFTVSILHLSSLDEFDVGTYVCQATNFAGNATHEFDIQVIGDAPVILFPLNLTRLFITGDDIVLNCSAAGVPHPSFTWYKDGSLLMNESMSLIINEESDILNGVLHTVSNMFLYSADEFDIGIYTCLATNFVGNDSAEFEVNGGAEITTLLPLRDMCMQEEVITRNVIFIWLDTNSSFNATFVCPNNKMFNVSRQCLSSGQWGRFDDEGCGVLASEFEAISMASQNLTNETLGQAVKTLSNIVQDSTTSPVEQNTGILNNIANTLTNVASLVDEADVEVNVTVVENIVEILNSLVQWTPMVVMASSSSQIVKSFEKVTTNYIRQIPPNTNVTITTRFVTTTAENVVVEKLQVTGRSLTFKDGKANSESEVKPGQLHPQQNSAVSLPASLFRLFHDRENIGIYFTIYESATLFPVNDSKVPGEQTKVGSQVVGINVDSSQDLVDLEEPIIIVLRPQLEQDNLTFVPGSEMCVSWNFLLQDWTPDGCETSVSQDGIVTCTCNHLTNYCMLVDICLRQKDCLPSKVEFILTYVSYTGLPISITCLVLTLITLITSKKLRQKDVSKYHVQLSLSLMLLFIVGLVLVVFSAEKITPYYGGCVTMSVLVHYFALVAVMLMAAECVLMFRKLITPFAQITPKYNVVVSAICWCTPSVPVVIPLIVDLVQGNDSESDIVIRRGHKPSFCFLSHVGAFWGAFLAPIFAIMLFNVVLFVCIIVVLIRHVRSRSLRTVGHVDHKDIVRTAFSIFGLMSLFGLTWLFAVFTFSVSGLRETFQLLFTVFNSFQGAFMFLFICVFSSEVRDEWKLWYFNHRKSTNHTNLSQQQHFPSKQYTACMEAKTKSYGMSVPNPLLKSSEKKPELGASLVMKTTSTLTAHAAKLNFSSTDIAMDLLDVSKKAAEKSGDGTNSLAVYVNSYAHDIENNQLGVPYSGTN